jgi:hypothetical protein
MTTNLIIAMWSVWGVFTLVTVVLYAYRSSLTRDEEGQIFLDEAFAHEKAVQTAIVSKVSRLQPILRASLITTVVLTVIVVGYYAVDAYRALFG